MSSAYWTLTRPHNGVGVSAVYVVYKVEDNADTWGAPAVNGNAWSVWFLTFTLAFLSVIKLFRKIVMVFRRIK